MSSRRSSADLVAIGGVGRQALADDRFHGRETAALYGRNRGRRLAAIRDHREDDLR